MLYNKYIANFVIALLIFSVWSKAIAEPIDINTATAQELDESLPGIGPSKAEVIINYRNKHGPFKSLDDLDNVPGIGPKILERISDSIKFENTAINNTAINNTLTDQAPVKSEPVNNEVKPFSWFY